MDTHIQPPVSGPICNKCLQPYSLYEEKRWEVEWALGVDAPKHGTLASSACCRAGYHIANSQPQTQNIAA